MDEEDPHPWFIHILILEEVVAFIPEVIHNGTIVVSIESGVLVQLRHTKTQAVPAIETILAIALVDHLAAHLAGTSHETLIILSIGVTERQVVDIEDSLQNLIEINLDGNQIAVVASGSLDLNPTRPINETALLILVGCKVICEILQSLAELHNMGIEHHIGIIGSAIDQMLAVSTKPHVCIRTSGAGLDLDRGILDAINIPLRDLPNRFLQIIQRDDVGNFRRKQAEGVVNQRIRFEKLDIVLTSVQPAVSV